MTEAIYRVGDILEIPGNVVLPRQFGMFPKEETCRCLVLNVLHPGFDSISYTFLTHKDGFGTFNIIGVNHTNIADCAKLIGHCDISALRYEKPEEGSGDTDLLMLFTAGTIAYTADLRNELDKIKKENEKLKAENEALSDTLSKSEVKAQSRLNRNEVLKRENEELRGHNEKLYEIVNGLKSICANCEARSENERLRADNEKLKATNSRFLQKIKFAEGCFDSAAAALYDGREHLSVALHSIDNK